MKTLALIMAAGYIGFHFSDVRGGGVVGAYLAPLLVFAAIVAFMLWIKRRSMRRHGSADHGDGPITISPSDYE